MKFRIFTISFMTVLLLVVPAFLVHINDAEQAEKQQQSPKAQNENKYQYTPFVKIIKQEETAAAFSSQTSYKKTYYTSRDKVYVYSDSSGKGEPVVYLQADTPVVALKEENRFVYCEINNGMKGWIRLDKNDIKLVDAAESVLQAKEKGNYFIEVSVYDQNIRIYNKGILVKDIKCSTGILGDPDTETPLGVFKIQDRNTYFFNEEYNEGAKYYVQFFTNYLIHSVPVDKKGNIIEEENSKLGIPASHGCIRVPMEEAKWIYENVPRGTEVYIHY